MSSKKQANNEATVYRVASYRNTRLIKYGSTPSATVCAMGGQRKYEKTNN